MTRPQCRVTSRVASSGAETPKTIFSTKPGTKNTSAAPNVSTPVATRMVLIFAAIKAAASFQFVRNFQRVPSV